jgi:hypothetical protein
VSAGARNYILQHLAHVPPENRQSAVCKVLESCLNEKMSSREEEYWDPVLYHGRDIELADVARVIESQATPGAMSGI